jgi:hypothetical protein
MSGRSAQLGGPLLLLDLIGLSDLDAGQKNIARVPLTA